MFSRGVLLELLGGLLGRLGCGRRRSIFERSEFLHQAALAAGGIVLVDDAFFSSLVEGADRLQDRSFRLGLIRIIGCTCLIDGSTSGAADVAITQAAGLVLTVSFDL